MKTDGAFHRNRRQVTILLLWAVLSVWCLPKNAQAYRMPSEQIINLMLRNFSEFHTLVIYQSTQLITPEDLEIQVVMEEKVWLKSPKHIHSELSTVPNDGGSIENELPPERLNTALPFHRLFLATDKETITTFLSEMGVNLGSVAFTRYDGRIAYRLGDQDAKAPKLIIEKDRFLPMLFCYQLWVDQGRKRVTVRFDDYRQVDGGWYPHELALYAGEEFQERSVVNELEVNPPIDVSFFENRKAHIRSRKQFERDPEPPDEGRLRQVIELLKEKYRHTDSSVNGN